MLHTGHVTPVELFLNDDNVMTIPGLRRCDACLAWVALVVARPPAAAGEVGNVTIGFLAKGLHRLLSRFCLMVQVVHCYGLHPGFCSAAFLAKPLEARKRALLQLAHSFPCHAQARSDLLQGENAVSCQAKA